MNSSLKPQVNQVLLAVLPFYFLTWWHLNELCQLRQTQSLIFFLFTRIDTQISRTCGAGSSTHEQPGFRAQGLWGP